MMKNFWDYRSLQNEIDPKYRIDINAGKTPLNRYSENILLKREDQNPTGSHKDRSLQYQLSAHIQQGESQFVISSSGNSVISAIKMLRGRPENIHIFLSHNLSISKRKRLSEIVGITLNEVDSEQSYENFFFYFTNRAVSDSFKFSRENRLPLLRGSTDEYAIPGFKTIAYELADQEPESDAIFVPTSSGTTAYGIYLGYQEALNQKFIKKLPQIHIIQTSKVNLLARTYDQDYEVSKSSLATSIVDKIGHRRDNIREVIANTKGSGWIVSDEEIRASLKELSQQNINVSADAALSLAGLRKAKSKGMNFKKAICILSGTE